MKRFLILASLILTTPAFAQTTTPTPVKPKVYRPFVYETACALDSGMQTQFDTCKVVETRETGGALRTRNIYSNRFGLTIKSWFDKKQGFMTWDSHNKFAYKWEYKVAGTGEQGAWSLVMPGVLLQNVSWD
jgi:hypothetical protein